MSWCDQDVIPGLAGPLVISLGHLMALCLPEGWVGGYLDHPQSKSPSGGPKAWLCCAHSPSAGMVPGVSLPSAGGREEEIEDDRAVEDL